MPSALCTEPPDNYLAFSNSPLTEGARRRLVHVVPCNVLNSAAMVTDEVMMRHPIRIEARGTALYRHFAHQARLHQVPQIVIRRRP